MAFYSLSELFINFGGVGGRSAQVVYAKPILKYEVDFVSWVHINDFNSVKSLSNIICIISHEIERGLSIGNSSM